MEEFSIVSEFCTGDKIEKLAKLMPNVTQLSVGLGNDGFEMVCKMWNKLQSLSIHPFQVDEKGLLGIGTGSECYQLPNITDLKCKICTSIFKVSMIRDDKFQNWLDFRSQGLSYGLPKRWDL